MDEHAMLALLRELVEIESPTYSPGVRRVAERVGEELSALGAEVELLEGDHLRADLPGEGDPLLVLGHCDTVWPKGTLTSFPFRIENGSAYGPGSYDMKGCLVLMLAAICEAGANRRALRVFLTADEEQGSRTGRALIEEAAQGAAAALVVEPPGATGELKTALKGLGRFLLTVTGRPAHVAARPLEGVSAIEELAHQILELHAMNDERTGLSVNVGVIAGGTGENVVAAHAEARVDVRVARAADTVRAEAMLAGLKPKLQGTSLAVSGGWTRPPLERSSGTGRMFEQARRYGIELGLDLREGSSGGGSDGNLVGVLGVPVLDGLGVEGGGAHALNEHVVLESMPFRARLLARLLEDPGL
jgi:glutamate carboxypeptidase